MKKTCSDCGAFQGPDDLACRQCQPAYYGEAHELRDRLTAFLYILMRDKLPFGEIVQLVNEVTAMGEFDLTAKGVGFYAHQLAERLMRAVPKDPLESDA